MRSVSGGYERGREKREDEGKKGGEEREERGGGERIKGGERG